MNPDELTIALATEASEDRDVASAAGGEKMNIWTCVYCERPICASVIREAGGACSLCGKIGFKYGPAKTLEDVCLAQPWRFVEPCPACGYVAATTPAWAQYKATFAVGGKRYRIVSIGSTNRYSPRHTHSEDYLRCEPVAESWALPATPCPTSDIAAAITDLYNLPAFRAHELVDAYMIEVPQ